ncbi:NAD-dependent deacylase [Corynebacterium sp. TAE3-ERU12]|uniref:NAD-dependent deacylase n=1 Tax=Corynebacterium sp. TAE3-ERU12 TaxID=2849491 RepID=UPI001C43AE1E|nr:NAD-dependent deacylase [Corynebacterium sp. TAE3-ERU12]MBV7295036.1 NAD-dependent deacylase [Corynebacterium sp. TAE3-ERU12]
MTSQMPTSLADAVRAAHTVAFFTGAGMSADSGLDTFRDSTTGLWSHVDPQAMASTDAWFTDPGSMWPWYLWRLRQARQASPHPGHIAIAQWSQHLAAAGGWGHVTTQNIDDLHERAGSDDVAHLHGKLNEFRCDTCAHPAAEPEPLTEPTEYLQPPLCTMCLMGHIRPGVVWFGEALPAREWSEAEAHITTADLIVVVGTSGVVYPAAGLPLQAARRDIPIVEISPQETDLSPLTVASWRTTAAQGLPAVAHLVCS